MGKFSTVPKVLICSPTAEIKDYCFKDWLANVRGFSYPSSRYDIFLADNSETNHYYKYLIKQGIKTEYIKTKGRTLMERMALSHEACRQYAIRNKYDIILHLETDVFVRKDIIETLLFHRKKVIGILYHILHLHFVQDRRLVPVSDAILPVL